MQTGQQRKERFESDIKDHQIEIVYNNGVHRHLKVTNHGRVHHHFNITTWPGYLCISGDMETFVFSREPDMFEFFRGQDIDPFYWGEKVRAGEWLKYCADSAKERVAELVKEGIIPVDHDDSGDLDYSYSDYVIQHLTDVGYDGAWEEDFRVPTPRYEWCLRAILWAIDQFDTETAGESNEMGEEASTPPTRREQEAAMHKAVMERFDAMTEDERLQTFIDVGIINQKHELSKRYGGSGEIDPPQTYQQTTVGALRVGDYVINNDEVCQVLSCSHVEGKCHHEIQYRDGSVQKVRSAPQAVITRVILKEQT